MDEHNEQNDHDHLARTIAEQLRDQSELCAVPVYVVQQESFRQHGTGTLLKVGSRSFLLTAAHVVNQADDLGLPLYVADFAAGSRFERLHGTRQFVRDPRFDIAIVELTPRLIECLANRKFLSLADIDFRDHVRDGLFFLFGYPCEWNFIGLTQRSITPRYLGYVTRAYKGPLNTRSYDPRFHLLLSACKATSRPIDKREITLPSQLGGISGSAIWKTYTERQSASSWKPDSARIVAIETMAYGDSHEIIRGTHAGCVVRVLNDAYPDLRPILHLHLRLNRF